MNIYLIICCLGILFFTSEKALSQIINTATMDTTDTKFDGKVTVEGYVDAYFGYDFNEPKDANRPYFVSSSKHNELNINLAYIDVKYSSEKLRARFVPAFGSYINANYATEEGSLKNLVEASVGVKLSTKRNIWLEAGVFGSPYTNESAISKDHLMYTRSFAPEYVPYYLSGLKFSIPMSSKVNVYLYVLNGWQQIKDANSKKSIGTQVEYRPTDKLLLNWNTYIGDERSESNPQNRMRYFTDVFALYNPSERLSFTSCVYVGWQEVIDNQNNTDKNRWWQANVIARYGFTKKVSLSSRIEYFDDPQSVQIVPITNVNGFKTYSAGVCLNVKVMENALFRLESRHFFAPDNVFLDKNQIPTDKSNLGIASMTIWF